MIFLSECLSKLLTVTSLYDVFELFENYVFNERATLERNKHIVKNDSDELTRISGSATFLAFLVETFSFGFMIHFVEFSLD